MPGSPPNRGGVSPKQSVRASAVNRARARDWHCFESVGAARGHVRNEVIAGALMGRRNPIMLPKTLRFWLFEALSLRTMRYVHAIPRRKATGLVAQVYDMIEEDFFINGSLISRSKVPALMAGIWTAGRESILVDDHLDRTTKEAMNAALSQVNDCPYCG